MRKNRKSTKVTRDNDEITISKDSSLLKDVSTQDAVPTTGAKRSADALEGEDEFVYSDNESHSEQDEMKANDSDVDRDPLEDDHVEFEPALENDGLAKSALSKSEKNKLKRQKFKALKKQKLAPKSAELKWNPDSLWEAYMNFKKEKNLSELELADLESCRWNQDKFVIMDSFGKNKTADNLHAAITQVSPLTSLSASSPQVVVVCSGALRCIEIINCLRKEKSISKNIAKLFARHMKLHEQIDYLKSHDIAYGVGTPHRILKIWDEMGHDFVAYTRLVVLDASYLDCKQRSLMDSDECKEHLFTLISRIQQHSARIIIF